MKEWAISTPNKHDAHDMFHLPLSSTCTATHTHEVREKPGEKKKNTKKPSRPLKPTVLWLLTHAHTNHSYAITYLEEGVYETRSWKAFVEPISHAVNAFSFINVPS